MISCDLYPELMPLAAAAWLESQAVRLPVPAVARLAVDTGSYTGGAVVADARMGGPGFPGIWTISWGAFGPQECTPSYLWSIAGLPRAVAYLASRHPGSRHGLIWFANWLREARRHGNPSLPPWLNREPVPVVVSDKAALGMLLDGETGILADYLDDAGDYPLAARVRAAASPAVALVEIWKNRNQDLDKAESGS